MHDTQAALAHSVIDDVLHVHAEALGRDLQPYRHHAHRVAAFCMTLVPASHDGAHDVGERVALAAAFHDLGIWTHGTFDYLEPSIEVCRAYLSATGRVRWGDELSAMIREHHKLTAWTARPDWLVEPFRKADWIDVTRGLIPHGVPRSVRQRVFASWPSLGFRRRLVHFTLARLRHHPLHPLPMLRF